MHSTKKLTAVLRSLVALLEDEAARNPVFAQRLDEVLSGLPSKNQKRSHPKPAMPSQSAPDVFASLEEKGETEFRFWVRSLDVATLKSIIKTNGFDPAKASRRWTDPDKFAQLVSDQTLARSKRGSAFLSVKPVPEHGSETSS